MVTHIFKPWDDGIMKGYALGKKMPTQNRKRTSYKSQEFKRKNFNNNNFHLSVFFIKFINSFKIEHVLVSSVF